MATERFGHYFKYFPTRTYDSFDGTTQHKVVKDIFRRVRATLEARQDHAIYYKYTVPEGETPEIVSYKYYGAVRYHWVILLMNQIRDPQWGWPLSSSALEKYIVAKYGGTDESTQIHSHYETNEIRARATDDMYVKNDIILNSGMTVNANFTYTYTSYHANNITGQSVPGTVHTFTVDETLKTFSMYDKEIADNEKKRDIILLRRNLLQDFVDEFDELLIKRI